MPVERRRSARVSVERMEGEGPANTVGTRPDPIAIGWPRRYSAIPTGTRPVTVVPDPGRERISSVPPIASRRSAIPCSPVP